MVSGEGPFWSRCFRVVNVQRMRWDLDPGTAVRVERRVIFKICE